MQVRGRVLNGVVVLSQDCAPPEGAEVTVAWIEEATAGTTPSRPRIQLPLIYSSRPGSVPMTSDRVAELLEEEDVSA